MLFQSVFAVGLVATSVFAAPVETEVSTSMDLPAIQTVFDSIMAGVDAMVKDINDFHGSLNPFVNDSKKIQKTIVDGTATIKASPTMGIADLLNILGPVGTLSNKIDEIINALNTKRPEIEKAGLSSVVIDELQKQRVVAADLSKTITGGLPLAGIVGIVANPIAKQITDKLDAGIVAWGGQIPSGSAAAPKSSGSAPKATAPKGKGKSGGK